MIELQTKWSEIRHLLETLLENVKSHVQSSEELTAYAKFIKNKCSHLPDTLDESALRFDHKKTKKMLDNYIKRIQLEEEKLNNDTSFDQCENTLNFLNDFETRVKKGVLNPSNKGKTLK